MTMNDLYQLICLFKWVRKNYHKSNSNNISQVNFSKGQSKDLTPNKINKHSLELSTFFG